MIEIFEIVRKKRFVSPEKNESLEKISHGLAPIDNSANYQLGCGEQKRHLSNCSLTDDNLSTPLRRDIGCVNSKLSSAWLVVEDG